MSKKLNFFIIAAIFVLPIVFYYLLSPAKTTDYNKMAVATQEKPLVIDFASPLCLECKQLAKVLDSVIPKYKAKVDFQKINVNTSSSQSLINKYKINVVPTLVFVNKSGKVVRKTEGMMTESKLDSYMKSLANGK